MTNEANLTLEETKLTQEEIKKAEKEKKRIEKYNNGMISRKEAYQMSTSIAREEVGGLAEFMREPLRVNMVQTMALVELLIDKELITKDEFQEYLDKVFTKVVDEVKKDGEASVEEEGTEGSNTEEA